MATKWWKQQANKERKRSCAAIAKAGYTTTATSATLKKNNQNHPPWYNTHFNPDVTRKGGNQAWWELGSNQHSRNSDRNSTLMTKWKNQTLINECRTPFTRRVEVLVINQTILNVTQQSTKIKETAYSNKKRNRKNRKPNKKCSRDKCHTWWQIPEQHQAEVEQVTHS